MRRCLAVLSLAALLVPGAGLGADFFVYPQKGQSAEQQARDESECRRWATGQTGFDPATAPRPQQQQGYQEGGAVRGAARGAAQGAVVGANAGSAGTGAAAGAAGGGLIGGMRRRDSQRRDDYDYQQQVNAYNARYADWQRASKACLTARGYSVN